MEHTEQMEQNEITDYLARYGANAREAAVILSQASTDTRNKALTYAAEMLRANTEEILAGNAKDMEKAIANGMSVSMQDRLRLTPARICGIAEGVDKLVGLADPIGDIIEGTVRPNGLEIIKKRVPLGVIGMIYEARPNVTADAAGLCIKSGNACILRGGSEAIEANKVIAEIFRAALHKAGLPQNCVQLIDNTSREVAQGLMRLNSYVDVLIPRGGAGLINMVVNSSTVPVIQTGTGNCHIYVDKLCDEEMALNIVINAKTQRPSVCNAAETLLVHEAKASSFLPIVCAELLKKGVELRVCPIAERILAEGGIQEVNKADALDWSTEYNDLIIAIKVVSDLEEAIDHIGKYTTHHSEAIVTDDYNSAREFRNRVDAACVYVNASTRFTDGFEFGFGAEIGISNQKLHVRGPIGLKELTTFKYLINGNGQIRP